MKDPRPKRTKKPGVFLIVLMVICTPIWLAIPVIGWIFAIIMWIFVAIKYRQASVEQYAPFGTFRGE